MSITLFYRVKLIGVFVTIALCAMVTVNARASDFTARVGAVLVDPLVMDLKEAKRFCKEEPQAVKCDILHKQIKQSPKDKISKNKRHYHLLNVNFE